MGWLWYSHMGTLEEHALFNFLSQKNEKSKKLIPKNFKYDSDDEVESEEEEVDHSVAYAP